jgi:hypothetical protein
MMIFTKDFDNEENARRFRESQRDKKLAASLFNYGKGRFRVKVMDTENETRKGWTQSYLSDSAWKVSNDIKELTAVKDILAKPNFDSNIEDLVTVARKLNKDNYFKRPKDVIDFLDGLSDKELTEVRNIIDGALQEYDEEWNDKHAEATV